MSAHATKKTINTSALIYICARRVVSIGDDFKAGIAVSAIPPSIGSGQIVTSAAVAATVSAAARVNNYAGDSAVDAFVSAVARADSRSAPDQIRARRVVSVAAAVVFGAFVNIERALPLARGGGPTGITLAPIGRQAAFNPSHINAAAVPAELPSPPQLTIIVRRGTMDSVKVGLAPADKIHSGQVLASAMLARLGSARVEIFGARQP